MMDIDFDELKGDKKEMYKHLWENNPFDAKIVLSGKDAHSYEFKFDGKTLVDFVADSLANNFGITKKDDRELFRQKFEMACSGTGDELKKITTLHSSSLCALLFFFNVNDKEKKLKIRGLEGYEFTESLFEFKNKVIGYPSNIDIVLLGTNPAKVKVVLFLESKFSEYITSITRAEKQYEIGSSYFKNDKDCFSKPIYDELEKKQILKKIEKGKKCYLTSAEDKYIEGLKQLISHYYGIRNFLKGEYYEKDNENLKTLQDFKADEYILGEILFDNFGDELKSKLTSYEKDYEKLAKIINDQYTNEGNNERFRVLDKPLHYSDLKNNLNIPPKVLQYYFGDKN